jgi:hypothetical protein
MLFEEQTFVGLQQPFRVIDHGNPGVFDNFHQTYRAMVQLPTVRSPGCEECVHIHWRWGKIFNTPIVQRLIPDAAAFMAANGNGQPIIPPGSDQTVDVAVVQWNGPSSEDPTDFTDLLLNNAPLKSSELEFWYSATGYQPSDTFFIHGGWFDPSANR